MVSALVCNIFKMTRISRSKNYPFFLPAEKQMACTDKRPDVIYLPLSNHGMEKKKIQTKLGPCKRKFLKEQREKWT